MSAYPIRDEKGRFRQAQQVTNPRPLHLRDGGRAVAPVQPMFRHEPKVGTPKHTHHDPHAQTRSMMEENPYGRKVRVKLDWEDRVATLVRSR